MKAIEIDWSKAPEGATHYYSEKKRWFRVLDNLAWFWIGDRWEPSNDFNIDRRMKTSDMIPRRTDWNGDGLPPVGTVCEGRSRKEKLGEVWGEVIVLAHRFGQAVVSFTDCERLQWCGEDDLRHIRTPEQIAAEERERAVRDMLCVFTAIKDKQAETMIGVLMGALYDAGYRKVEGDKQ